ncbi:MAG TPA: hypothetical protein DCG19_11535 [Cryomorphaceae bacterium]|nr:hypothetical protein [Owenweeksia sp.]MBF97935.1 hypothetical protein [Owenweeksia sp.]HAD98030.1 hypothetical protein [Cryomorphaceae bacterium]HBF20893.1 hypothetical protein [Cryomorphaceae bacterium]HCQ15272.1 hypothetical protein [Cryomorphaceae bacterium]
MNLPHFLVADNTDFPDEIFIVHTQYPRFVWSVNHDELEWMDELQGEEEELITEIANLLDCAEAFYEREMKRHEEELLT